MKTEPLTPWTHRNCSTSRVFGFRGHGKQMCTTKIEPRAPKTPNSKNHWNTTFLSELATYDDQNSATHLHCAKSVPHGAPGISENVGVESKNAQPFRGEENNTKRKQNQWGGNNTKRKQPFRGEEKNTA